MVALKKRIFLIMESLTMAVVGENNGCGGGASPSTPRGMPVKSVAGTQLWLWAHMSPYGREVRRSVSL